MKLKTYKDWQDIGYQVKRGEKAQLWKDGLPLFSRDQVEERDDFDRTHKLRYERE